ncbi:unnamed protein product, partial [Owenia fusiformis]
MFRGFRKANMIFSPKYLLILTVLQILKLQNGLYRVGKSPAEYYNQSKRRVKYVNRREVPHTSHPYTITDKSQVKGHTKPSGVIVSSQNISTVAPEIGLTTPHSDFETSLTPSHKSGYMKGLENTTHLQLNNGDQANTTSQELEHHRNNRTAVKPPILIVNGEDITTTIDQQPGQTQPPINSEHIIDAANDNRSPRISYSCKNPDSLKRNVINDNIANCANERPFLYSCIDKCGQSQITCGCDIYCKFYDDCCIDFASYCPSEERNSKYIPLYGKPDCWPVNNTFSARMVTTCNDNNNTVCPTTNVLLDNVP